VVSCTETPTADFTRNRNWHFPLAGLKQQLVDTLGPDQAQFIDAQHLATALMGDALYANMLLLGYAWQQGLVPVSAAALNQAIELNGAAVAANRQAFLWGRRAADDPRKVAAVAGPLAGQPFVAPTLDELITSRIDHLTTYQDAALARRYEQRIENIRVLGNDTLTTSVATQYARLLAPKDEYEVARLYAETDFLANLGKDFDGELRLSFNFAPPFLAKPGSNGRPQKITFGPWLLPVLKILAKARRLRGSWLDPFRFSPETTVHRSILADYENDLDLILSATGEAPDLLKLAGWPAEVRGFGLIRQQAATQAKQVRENARRSLMA
jgi:indolepyruvate ferredoxin oxidoreductase